MVKRKYVQLNVVADFRNQKIETKLLNENCYISTENMIAERGGVIAATTLPTSNKQCKFNEQDILLSNIRPYFKKIWFANKIGGCSNDVLVVETQKRIIPKFLYYVLSDNNFFNYASVTSKGTKMPRGSKSAIMKYLVPEVDLKTQEKIADILSTYDDLIENNNKRISLLEKAAQNLYKEWFVRFRFPGHENTKFVNGLPVGWDMKILKQYGEIETGKTPSTAISDNYGKDILFIKTPDMHGNAFVLNTAEMLSKKGHDSQPKKLLQPNSIMVSCIGTGGVVSINSREAHTNQQINSIKLTDDIYLEWLFYTCKELKQTIELFGATGATMTNLSKGKFEKLKVIDPPKKIVYLFHEKTNELLLSVKKLMEQNQNLKKQRDLLLPRLMSGKLEV